MQETTHVKQGDFYPGLISWVIYIQGITMDFHVQALCLYRSVAQYPIFISTPVKQEHLVIRVVLSGLSNSMVIYIQGQLIDFMCKILTSVFMS